MSDFNVEHFRKQVSDIINQHLGAYKFTNVGLGNVGYTAARLHSLFGERIQLLADSNYVKIVGISYDFDANALWYKVKDLSTDTVHIVKIV